MTITPDQADRLKQGVTKTPWRAIKSDLEIHPTGIVRDADDETIGAAEGGHVDPEFTHGQADLIAAAPELAHTVAALRWEYGVEQSTGTTQWFRSRPMTEAHAEVRGAYRLIRRLVGPAEPIAKETSND